jgi:hypothetical protein
LILRESKEFAGGLSIPKIIQELVFGIDLFAKKAEGDLIMMLFL